jgi:hypothetical protein
MATEKDLALAKHLIKLAKEGKLKWEATARANEFTASIKGKYNISVSRGRGGFGSAFYEGDPEYNLKLIDPTEQELVRLTEKDYIEVVELFDLARRSSLNVDAAIDEILLEGADDLPL